jgi:hypothetical protein
VVATLASFVMRRPDGEIVGRGVAGKSHRAYPGGFAQPGSPRCHGRRGLPAAGPLGAALEVKLLA